MLWVTIIQGPKLLTAIFKIGQGACHCLFGLSWQPLILICITEFKLLFNYLSYKTQNCWGSIDPHFQPGTGSVSLSLFLKFYSIILYIFFKFSVSSQSKIPNTLLGFLNTVFLETIYQRNCTQNVLDGLVMFWNQNYWWQIESTADSVLFE